MWTTGYTVLNVMYFAAFCTLHAYAAVFLLSRGFSNTSIGILLAAANITSALFQPFVAGIIDKGGWLTNRRFIFISCLIILAGSAVLRVISSQAAVFVIFALIYMIQFAYQPVMTALCFEYQKKGCDIYYGLARGLGSAGFAVTSALIGSAVTKYGETLLMTVTAVIMIISAISRNTVFLNSSKRYLQYLLSLFIFLSSFNTCLHNWIQRISNRKNFSISL